MTDGRAAQRWRYAVFTGAGTATALVIALALQVDTFFAPMIAFRALYPYALWSWRRILRCVWICTAAVVLTLSFGSVLLQVPWLLLPCTFAVTAAALYAIPLSSSLLEALAVLPPMLRIVYVGVFHPSAMGTVALSMWSAYAIGIGTAAVFGHLFSPAHPRAQLAAALAASFDRSRTRLRTAGTRFRDLARAPEPISLPTDSDLTARLQLLDHVRQEGVAHAEERALLALMTTAERAETAVRIAEALAAQPIGTTYRPLIDQELGDLLAALDTALARFAAAAQRVFAPAAADAAPWPDVLGALAALEARQLALRHGGAFAAVRVAEGAHVNGFVDQLRALTQAVRISPDELERMAGGDPVHRAAEPPPAHRLRFDPYAARFSLKAALATMIALQIPLAAHVDALFSLVIAPVLVAQSSYGATIERAPQRLLGVLIGGVLALLTMVLVMVNTDDITVWALVFFAVIAGCTGYIMSSPRAAYVGTQIAITYMFVTVTGEPTTDVGLALWRAVGNFVGGVVIVGTFRLVAPDYAGRQLIARLADLLADVLALLPAPDERPTALRRALAIHRDIGQAVADLLRLVAEARIEGELSGIDPAAAVEAAGLAQRIAYRAVAIARTRELVTTPALPPEVGTAWADARRAVRAHVERVRAVLIARHTLASPGTRRYRAACAAAVAAAAAPRPDLARAFGALVDAIDRVRPTALADWPAAATGSLFSQIEHIRRIVDLLPALESRAVTVCVPREENPAPLPVSALSSPAVPGG
jgi:uncharacterized membrane protein YccC